MAANGKHDYPNLAAFVAAATAGLLAVASGPFDGTQGRPEQRRMGGKRTVAQFREWLRWATVERRGLEPETHKLLDMMAAAAAKGSSGSGTSGLGTATKVENPKTQDPAVQSVPKPQDPRQ